MLDYSLPGLDTRVNRRPFTVETGHHLMSAVQGHAAIVAAATTRIGEHEPAGQ